MNEQVRRGGRHRISQREEEVQFRLLAENVQDVAIFLMDAEGRITSWNPGAERLKGWSTEEVIGQDYRLLYLPEDAAARKPEEHLKHARESGKFEEQAWRLRKDGSRFWAHVVLTPLYDDGGKLHGFAKITQDRSSEKAYEERLQRQFSLTEAITHHAADAIFLMDREGRTTFANAAAERMFGWSEAELREKSLHDVLHHQYPDGSPFPMSECQLGGVFRSGTTLRDHEDLFLHREGHQVPVLCSNAPIVEDGEVTAAVLVVHDLTERKRLEMDLQRGHAEREQLLIREREARAETERERDLVRRVVENAPLAIGVLEGPEHRFTLVNPATSRLAGLPPDALLGRAHGEVLPETDRTVGPILDRVLRTGQPEVAPELEVPLGNGKSATLHVTWTPLPGPEGSPNAVLYLGLDLTELRVAQEALYHSEARFRALFNQVTVGIALADRAGQLLLVNQRQCDILERSARDLLQMRMQDVTHPEDLPANQALFERLVRKGEPFVLEERYVRPDGSWIWANTSVSPIFAADGKLEYVVAVVEDITKRKRAEEALRASEARFRTVFTAAPVGIALVGVDGKILESNPALHELLGYGAEELRGLHPGDLTHPEDQEADTALFLQVLERKRDSYQLEKRYLRKDGEVLWGRLTAGVVRDETGHPQFAVGMVEDVTAQRQVEAEQARRARDLQNQQEWLQDVLNLTPTPLLFIEPGTGRVTFANRAANDMAGGEFPRDRPAEEYHTLYYCTDAAGERIPNEQMPGIRVARGERLEGFQMDWHLPGGVKSVLAFGDTLPPLHGHPATCVVQFNDVSHLKQVEAELREANERKDEFLAMLAHELRNPLGAIRNAVTLVQRAAPGSPPFERGLEVAARQIQHQSRIVDDLLDLSRITRGKLELRREHLDLAQLIRDTVDDFRSDLERRGLSLSLEVLNGAVPVYGDGTRLAQVLGNLLHNAGKFTPSGGTVAVLVSIGLAGEGEPDRLAGRTGSVHFPRRVAAVQVRDTGIGVSPEMLPQLFEPFSQADRSLDRSRGGLGLGLALVKGLVEMHGGRVWGHSAGEGKGAEFAFSLPLDLEAPITGVHITPSGVENGALRVLVIEDLLDAADTLCDLLELSGCTVQVAYSGPEGLRAADQFRPDVVLCDIGLPGMDGYAVARELRSRPGTANAWLIALTGYGQDEDQRRSREAGFDRHLTKPVDPDELQRVLASSAG